MNVLKLILARGGSKGLINKNIKLLLNKPLIQYSIESGKNSKYNKEVYVSTDCEKIAEVSSKLGAEIPFIRPKSLASDESKSSDAILHAISFFEKKNIYFDYILLLEPTSPLRTSSDINKCFDFFNSQPDAKSCVSVVKSEISHPSFLFEMNNNIISSYSTKDNIIRRQDLTALYYPEGSIYICDVNTYKLTKTFYNDGITLGYEFPYWKSFEIDTLEDFLIVESIMKNKLIEKL